MKHQHILVFLLLIGLAMPAVAQRNDKKVEERVQLARDRYAAGLDNISTNKEYERDGIPAVHYTTIVRKQNWAGSGMSNDKMDFYYNEMEDEMEPSPVGYELVMVRRSYNMGSMDYFEEYVYDAEGNPLFWFTRFGYKEGSTYHNKFELRGYYFADGSLARTICKKMDEKGEMKTCSVDEPLSEYGEATLESTFGHALEHFREFKAVFTTLYGMQYY